MEFSPRQSIGVNMLSKNTRDRPLAIATERDFRHSVLSSAEGLIQVLSLPQGYCMLTQVNPCPCPRSELRSCGAASVR